MLEPQERRAIEATLHRFAARIDEVLFAGEGPDGDSTLVPRLLAEARALDLVADPAADVPGYELGVWGTHCLEEGLELSLLTLSLLAEACAGFAAAVHAQGLACLALEGRARSPPGTPLAAVYMPHFGLPLRPEGSGLRLVGEEGAPTLSGASYFLLAAEVPRALVCFAQRSGQPDPQGEHDPDGEWASVEVKVGTMGVELVDADQRTGLRAARQYHLECDRVPIAPDQVLHRGGAALRLLQRVLACDWLGQAAIALGVARRALRDSRDYTGQRYQGGRIIEGHAAIQLLQATAEYDVALLEAILYRHAGEPLASLKAGTLLRWALAARLAVVENAHRAVTNCLQTLGGYGYMEDYGLEKRLRDVSTLKGLHGPPDQLKLLLNDLSRGARL